VISAKNRRHRHVGDGQHSKAAGIFNRKRRWRNRSSPPLEFDAPRKQGGYWNRRGTVDGIVHQRRAYRKSLREAMAFRRVEVAAFSPPKALLLLGASDVYFGTDCILKPIASTTVWEEHFQICFVKQIASDAEAANLIRLAIRTRRNSADSQILFSILLVGFSKRKNSRAGGRKTRLLPRTRPPWPVRVLAIENLR